MATRTAGFNEQIDELDHLLDKLLKLPIDKVRPAPRTPSQPPVQLVVAEVDDDPVMDDGILPFNAIQHHDEEHARTDMDSDSGQQKPVDQLIEEASAPTLPDLHEQSATAAIPSIAPQLPQNEPQAEAEPRLPVEEIPWIEDEPLGHRASAGPSVEIIVGPSCDVIVAPTDQPDQAQSEKTVRRSWLYWLFWFITWAFDQTLGYWFPWLRRPGVKFLLGLIGVVLFAVSIYLAWISWRQ